MKRRGNSGISLLNVLVVVAAGAGLVQVMLTEQESATDRLRNAADTGQAQALAEAAVTSVAVALRRDMVSAPDADHFAEPWADALQDTIALEFGRYSVTAEDLRGRFDLNALGAGRLVELRVFRALLRGLDLPESLATDIATTVTGSGALAAPTDLLALGFAATDLDRLLPHVTALPRRHPLNLNAVSEPLLAALMANPVAAKSLTSRRAEQGFLDRGDFATLGLAVPQLAGFTSDAFAVVGMAEVGQARSRLTRHVLRDAAGNRVFVISPGQ